MIDWNDLRYVLHVAHEGSTLAASRTLRISQTTVMRRIVALEAQLGFALFDKRRTGYVPTEALAGLMERLEAVESAHLAFDRDAGLARRGLSGTVRFTAPELLAAHFMRDTLMRFRRAYPAIRIELLATDRSLDLTAGEADVALRAGERPTEPTLFGRRIVAREAWSVCCSRAYAEQFGHPRDLDEIGRHVFIGPMEGIAQTPLTRWIEANVPEAAIAIRQNSVGSIHASVRAGSGLSICPDLIVDGDPEMMKCFPVDIDLGHEIWLLAPARHRDTAHVRVFLDFLSTHLTTLARLRDRAP
jgi:DNA-binding transcriptional LysR family regulator